jgi:hypothetical protein
VIQWRVPLQVQVRALVVASLTTHDVCCRFHSSLSLHVFVCTPVAQEMPPPSDFFSESDAELGKKKRAKSKKKLKKNKRSVCVCGGSGSNFTNANKCFVAFASYVIFGFSVQD